MTAPPLYRRTLRKRILRHARREQDWLNDALHEAEAAGDDELVGALLDAICAMDELASGARDVE